MEETTEPRVLHEDVAKRRKLNVKPTDVAIFGVIIIIIAVLGSTIIHKLNLKHEVAGAKPVADKVVNAMATQNTAAILALGDKKFQADHTATELGSHLTFQTSPPITFAAMYGDSKPAVDGEIVSNDSKAQHVVVIYRYDKLKVPFYVRVDTIKPANSQKWYLQALSASSDQNKLLTQPQGS
jgi:hypothetical protein